jgi:uncharacterized membrane protein YeaQ/YmgE (transglycosylase-associated protein family)
MVVSAHTHVRAPARGSRGMTNTIVLGVEPATAMGLSILVWAMIGIACWHVTVLVPDRFWGGIVGAFLVALVGALVSGFFLPEPGVPRANPPGVAVALWALPGAAIALAASYWHGSRRDAARGIVRD